MLPPSYTLHHRELQAALLRLMTNLEQGSGDPAALKTDFAQVQQYFQDQVANLDPDLLAPGLRSQVQAVYTEINKQLRLLATDWMFLASARQRQTLDQRIAQIRNRLQHLLIYCDQLLQMNP
jgi:hypothetical protein